MGRFQKGLPGRAQRPHRGVKLRIATTSHGTKLDRSLFFICERFVDAHNVNRGVLVSLHETVTSIAVSILTSQYAMNLLSLLQNFVLIPSLENAGEDRAPHWQQHFDVLNSLIKEICTPHTCCNLCRSREPVAQEHSFRRSHSKEITEPIHKHDAPTCPPCSFGDARSTCRL